MLSQRRTAQFGLWAACLILVICITVIVAGASDDTVQSKAGASSFQNDAISGHVNMGTGMVTGNLNMRMSNRVNTLAAGQVASRFGGLQNDISQPVASIRQ